MAAKLIDIAKATRTSVSTVSRVLAGGAVSKRISPETRQRVREAAERLGYRPNLVARTLRTRKSHTIALLVTDIANPFFAQVGGLIEQKLHTHGYSLMLCNSGEDHDRENEYLALLTQKAIDGLIVVPLARTRAALARHLPRDIPLVILDRPIAGITSAVYTDQVQASDLLSDELDRIGVKKIAIVAGPSDVITHHTRAERLASRFQTLVRHEGPALKPTGLIAMETIRDVSVDAIICTNNALAQGVIDSTADLEHSPVIGVFDEIPMMRLLPPPIVAVCQDIPLLAEGCVMQLLAQLREPPMNVNPIVLNARRVTNLAYDRRFPAHN